MRFWKGPWVWDTTEPGRPRYRFPEGVVQVLDLRSLEECATPGVTTSERAIFITPDDVALGLGYTEIPTSFGPKVASMIEDHLGLSQPLGVSAAADVGVALLTVHSDPTGATFARPLMPDRTGKLRYALGGRTLAVKLQEADPHFQKVRAVIQETYREYRERARNGKAPADLHQMALTVWAEQLGIADTSKFIPPDLPVEQPKPHRTTITESFNKADADTLGPDQTWSEFNFTNGGSADSFDVVSNQAAGFTFNPSFSGAARCEADTSSADHYVQAKLQGPFDGNFNVYGVTARHSASNERTCYYGLARYGSFDSSYNLSKNVAGTATDILTGTWSKSAGTVMKVQCNGSSIGLYKAGSEVSGSPVTDTSIASGTRGGLICYENEAGTRGKMDEWEMGDLAAATSLLRVNSSLRAMRPLLVR